MFLYQTVSSPFIQNDFFSHFPHPLGAMHIITNPEKVKGRSPGIILLSTKSRCDVLLNLFPYFNHADLCQVRKSGTCLPAAASLRRPTRHGVPPPPLKPESSANLTGSAHLAVLETEQEMF